MILALVGAALAGVVDAPLDPWAACVQRVSGDVPALVAAPGPHTRFALVVGAPCHHDPAIRPLSYANRDAARVAELLAGRGYAVSLLTTDVDVATFDAALSEIAARVPPDGELIVYFSGHGVLAERGGELDRLLVLADTQLARPAETGISVAGLEARLSGLDAAGRVLIQDTCFAALAPEDGKSAGSAGLNAKGQQVREVPLRAGDLRLYASRYYELAFESPTLRGSVYTHFLLQAAQDLTHDLDGDGCVDLGEAHHSAATATLTEQVGRQTPQISGAGRASLLGCTPRTPTRAVLGASRGALVDVAVRAGGDWYAPGSAVPPGPALLSAARAGLRDRPSPLRLAVGVRAGDRLDPDALARRADAWVAVDVGVVSLPLAATVPAWEVSLAGWVTTRQRGAGRWAVGLDVGGSPPAAVGDLARFAAGHARARVGWWAEPLRATRPWWGGGPVLGLGAWGRTPLAARADGEAFPTQWSPGFTWGARLHLGVQRWLIGVDVEGVGWLNDGQLRAEPMLRLGTGVRL